MMFLLRSLFPSKEVKLVLAAVNELLKEIEGELLSNSPATLSEYQALKQTRNSLKFYTKRQYVLAAYLLLEQEISPERVALDFTCKWVSDYLKSGLCTSYTHNLTYVGEGIYKIYAIVLGKYEANGIQTSQQSASLLNGMKVAIRSAPYKSPKGLFDFLHPKH